MEEVAWLLSGKLRAAILKALSNEELTPTMLAKKLNRHRESISRAIRDLKEKGYVLCMNPKADRWRFYKITPKGKVLLKKAKRYL